MECATNGRGGNSTTGCLTPSFAGDLDPTLTSPTNGFAVLATLCQPQGGIAAELVSRAEIGEGPATEVFGFEQLACEKIAEVHEGCQLRPLCAQLLDNTSTVDDFGVRDIGEAVTS